MADVSQPTESFIPRDQSPARWEWIALAIILVAGASLRLAEPNLSYFNLHVGRDLYRAMQLLRFDDFPLLGSEMQYGGRVFGPLIYFLYAIPLFVWESPTAIGIFIGLVNTGVLFWTWWFARRYFGSIAAITATGLFAVFPLEIVQLRYLWNPAFLPLMVLGMYHFLFRFIIDRKLWALLGVVLFFSLGFQLHFSVLMTIPAILGAMIAARRWPAIAVIMGCVVLVAVLFSPMMYYEIQRGQSNIKPTLQTEYARPGLLERHKLNPLAWRNLLHTVHFDWHESGASLGFTYLMNLKNYGQDVLGTFWYYLLMIVRVGALFQLLLWLVGIFACGRAVSDYRRNRLSLEVEAIPLAREKAVAAGLLLAWQFSPMMMLSFFNYHVPMGEQGSNSLVPLRYYLVTYPAQFILAGVGLRFLMSREKNVRERFGLWAVPTLILAAGYLFVSVSHLVVLHRTGKALDYLHARVPTLERMLEIRDVLLDDFQITEDDYYERVFTKDVLLSGLGEATLDWLITQNVRSLRNKGLPEGTFLYIVAPRIDAEEVELPPELESMELLASEEIGDIVVLHVRGVPPPGHPHFDASAKRNFYYRTERMKYLGRERPDA